MLRARGIAFYLFPQIAYGHTEQLRLLLIGNAPNLFQYLGVGKYLAGMGNEQAQQVVLCRCQLYLKTICKDTAHGKIDREFVACENRFVRMFQGTPQRCPDTCQQFADAKGLGKIVIRPCIKGSHLIIFPLPDREDDYGYVRPFPYAPDDLDTIHVRQPQIKKYYIRPECSGSGKASVSGVGLMQMEFF